MFSHDMPLVFFSRLLYVFLQPFNGLTFVFQTYDHIGNVSICQSTIIPPRDAQNEPIFSTQPLSLGDTLVNITTNGSSLNMGHRLKVAGFPIEGQSK